MSLETIDSLELIMKYKETGDIALRNKIILKYGNLVKFIAVSTRNMYCKYAETEDIVNEGIIALIAAIDNFDVSKNVKFETYASIRIKGAIIDFIRKQDFIPRNVRKFAKDLDKAYGELYKQLGREPETKEISEYMNIDEPKLIKLMSESASATTLSFEELLFENNFDLGENDSNEGTEAERNIINTELKKALINGINSLKEKEKQVISLYYYEKLKFSDIANVLDVSESRICQIHSKAITKLKYIIKDYLY